MAGELAAGRKRRRGLELILALYDQRIEEVEPGVGDLDQGLALAGRGRFDLRHLQIFGRPKRRADQGFHHGAPTFTHFSLTKGRIAAPARAGKAKGRNFARIGRQGSPPAGPGPGSKDCCDDAPRPFVPSRHWAPDAAVWAASALAPPVMPRPSPPSPRPRRKRRMSLPSPPWSRPLATGTCSSARPAKGASAIP